MSRQPRISGQYQHIIVRGIGRQLLFEDTADREKYISLLKRYAPETGVSVLAYCLMENHIHILIHDDNNAISAFMKKTGVSYAYYFNMKYERSGHLFQDRYKSEAISDDAYLLCVFRYILNNPVKAGISGAETYPWSSYREYGKENTFTATEILHDLIGNEESFRALMRQLDTAEYMEAEKPKKDDEWALEVLKKTLNVASGIYLQKLERKQRDEAIRLLKAKGISVRQIERLTGINRGIIQKA
ncbi:MAG: transposase [Clostridia bacterium]|nr:transposase [Clostridia bacterium]